MTILKAEQAKGRVIAGTWGRRAFGASYNTIVTRSPILGIYLSRKDLGTILGHAFYYHRYLPLENLPQISIEYSFCDSWFSNYLL